MHQFFLLEITFSNSTATINFEGWLMAVLPLLSDRHASNAEKLTSLPPN